MTTFLSALRAEFLASVPSTCISNDSKKDSQLLQSSSFSPSNRTVTRHRTFQDPFVSSEISHRDILKILQVNDTTQGQTIKYKSQKESLKTLKRQDGSKINNVIEVLLTLCHTHLETNRSNEVFTSFELAQSILQSIQENRDLETLQAHLFNLLGVEGMELIAFAVQNQKELLSKQKLDELQKMLRQQEKKTQRQASREIRKEANEENWLEAAGYDLEVVRLQREAVDHERRLESSSLIQREFGTLQGGYDSTGAAGQLMSAGVLTLPSSTKRTYFKGYEHVFIPAHAKKPLEKEDPLVEIASLDDFAQTAFHGISTLNRLQSKLFHAAYHSNQNLLVCAPTGAGKTNVAMLTILQEVKTQYIRSKDERSVSFTQRLAKIKIIYVAPMKALAQEVVTKFSERLRELKLQVRELTGDMQLTKREIDETHVIVTTPEKWDVITRKSGTQQSLLSQVKVLIIDEVHLLADERGPVIETIVARTLRRVESTQCMIRIVGLSATLPNYVDVATFLRVSVPSGDVRMQNAATNGGQGGLFYFDATYRPVPLDQTFIGVSTNGNLKDAVTLNTTALTTSFENEDEMMKDKKGTNTMSRQRQIELMMNKLTLAHCLKQVQAKEQVMVFVHSRKETGRTMRTLIELARGHEEEMKTLEAFLPPIELQLDRNLHERVLKSRNQEVKELLGYGLGIHHAGMLRSDRNLTEELFERGYIRVLCCTATLAWGVNLPAHSVLIKGTQVYNAAKGGITQLSILDVMQIFGRAGRPQYDTRGDAVLLTTQDNLAHYLRLLTTGLPMESALIQALPDHLNAEIVSNTITNLDEACTWLSYTYLYVRMRKNPLAYGMKWDDVQHDPMLVARRRQLILAAAEKLAACRMIKISREKGQKAVNGEPQVTFTVTSVGRVASHYYIQHTSIETFHELFEASSEEEDTLNWDTVFRFLCSSHEFEQLKSREDEMTELEQLQHRYCRYAIVGGGLDTSPGKTNILLQSLLSRGRISSFTLISDSNYVAQNGARVARALFEICLKKSRGNYAAMFLQLAKCIDQKLWFDQTPLLQFSNVPFAIIHELEHQSLYDAMIDPQACNLSSKALKWIQSLPFLDITNVQTQPVGKTMLKVTFELTPLFLEWKEGVFQGKTLASWIWIEDGLNGYIYHSEYYILHQARFLTWKARAQSLELECFLPVFLSQTQQEVQYVIRIFSDRFRESNVDIFVTTSSSTS
ncbi:putative Sec63 domain, transcription-repair coupling factor, C2 domain superfamily [Plasmopara halstedii]